MCGRGLEHLAGAFEVVLTHHRFTLVDRSAEEFIGEAETAGLGILTAAIDA
jgi:D-threo-aldose 1-dehydrogenase